MNKVKRNRKKKIGYLQKFKYNISLRDYGVSMDSITWCKKRCEGAWGWWFDTAPEWYTSWDPEQNTAYMSFQYRKDAVKFWFWMEKNIK